MEASSLPSFSKKKYFFPNTQVLGKRKYKMTEPTTQEQTPQVTVVKDDPTKVSKPPRDDPARIKKKERSEKQKANDRRLAQMAIERKNKRLEEMKKGKEVSSSTSTTHEESGGGSGGFMTLLLGGGLIAVVGVILAIWYFFRKKEGNALPSLPEESAPPEEADSD